MYSTVQSYLSINFYKYTPKNTCTLDELEKYSKERLQLYSVFLEAEQMNLTLHTNEWRSYINEKIHTHSLNTYMALLNDDSYNTYQEAQEKDLMSHWILSLCYCTTQELRNYFIKWELAWISMIYGSSNERKKYLFINQNKFKYQRVPSEEKEKLKENLLSCRSIMNIENFNKEKYYKTRFQNILSLVKEREVFINEGYAYFPEIDMIHLIKCALHSQLKEQLKWNLKLLPNVKKDDRILNLITSLPIIVPRLTLFENIKITLPELEETSRYYPLCMRHIHKILKTSHHLKHDCRMQYGIFLKNLGLPYEDAMQFFEQEFTKSMTKNWFDRKYAYYFKHYWGEVGSKIDYKPYSCKFIQSMIPKCEQHHGCPFKHWDKDILINEFKNDGLSLREISDIEDLISEKSYQHACTKYYCATNKVFRDTLIDSPNQYCAEALIHDTSLNNLMETICDTI